MKRRKPNILRISFLILLVAPRLWGAACCGGGTAIPSLITGDDRAQVSISLAHDSVQADVMEDGTYFERQPGESEITQTMRLSGAYRISQHWQVGAELPIAKRTAEAPGLTDSRVALADAGITVGYEFLDQTLASSLPRGFGFLKVTLPTGRSIYETSTDTTADVFGKGFYQLSLGTLFVKEWGLWDSYLATEIRYLFPRTFQKLEFRSGWALGAVAGMGYNPGSFRFGVALSPAWESARSTEGRTVSEGSSKFLWTASLSAGLRWNDTWSTSLTYSDQMLLNGAHNTTASRAIACLLQKRFEL